MVFTEIIQVQDALSKQKASKTSTFCQPALICYETQGQYIKDITRWRKDMNI